MLVEGLLEYFLCFYQRIFYYCRHPADHRCDPGLVFGVYFYQREEVTSVSGSVAPQQWPQLPVVTSNSKCDRWLKPRQPNAPHCSQLNGNFRVFFPTFRRTNRLCLLYVSVKVRDHPALVTFLFIFFSSSPVRQCVNQNCYLKAKKGPTDLLSKVDHYDIFHNFPLDSHSLLEFY